MALDDIQDDGICSKGALCGEHWHNGMHKWQAKVRIWQTGLRPRRPAVCGERRSQMGKRHSTWYGEINRLTTESLGKPITKSSDRVGEILSLIQDVFLNTDIIVSTELITPHEVRPATKSLRRIRHCMGIMAL
ncbi:hypothetical protein CCU68_25270 [Pseudomonas gingeri NCPPB 3146 = LMG 5327]|uniref:Uncharacterized protein n=1 Tax=Pseudomonas gingeri NCPPB 3146 = LMG 5327 TaxID=707248 RepID=A0ABX4XXC3_9PSED|nr:hypothetical protein CCU68_25270 [Pseudomonas gingeri NCPPB 3146 = LMG 5327]